MRRRSIDLVPRLDAIVITANPYPVRVEVLPTPHHNSSLQRSIAARDMQIMTRIVTSFRGAIDTISLASMTDAPDGCGRSRRAREDEVHGRPCRLAVGKGNALLI